MTRVSLRGSKRLPYVGDPEDHTAPESISDEERMFATGEEILWLVTIILGQNGRYAK